MKFTPHDYQGRAIAHMVRHRNSLVLLDPGYGKTVITLSAFEEMRRLFEGDRMLVIAPLAVCYNVWAQEAAKWDHLQHLSVGVLHGRKKAQVLDEPHDVFLINPEGIEWLAEQDWEWPDVLIIDESTKFKATGTTRFKALTKRLHGFHRRYGLTGTPIPNGLLDLFGQAFCIDLGATLGLSAKKYKQEFFVPVLKGNYYKWEARDDAPERIYKRMGNIALRLEGADLDLPDLVVSDVVVDMSPAGRRLYDELKEDMVGHIAQGDILALNAGSLTSKCRQVANGSIYCEDVLVTSTPARPDGQAGGRAYSRVHTAKEAALQRLVEELGGKPVLVAYDFKHDLAAIERALGPSPVLKGDDTALVEEWNAGNVPIMAAHPKSAGHGLNLQYGGHNLIWYAPPWDLELYLQMIRRLYRQGQLNRVQVYRLIARGTVDQVAARALQKKNANQQALLDALRKDLQ